MIMLDPNKIANDSVKKRKNRLSTGDRPYVSRNRAAAFIVKQPRSILRQFVTPESEANSTIPVTSPVRNPQ
jgi:hypothetical protein